jgi:hypothetical protein
VEWAGALGGDALLAALSATTGELRQMANRLRWRVSAHVESLLSHLLTRLASQDLTLDSSARKLRLFSVVIAPVHGHLVKRLNFNKDRQETPSIWLNQKGQNRYHAVIPIIPHFTNLEHLQIELFQGFNVPQVLGELGDVLRELELPIRGLTLINATHIDLRRPLLADFLSALPQLSHLHLCGITVRDEELEPVDDSAPLTGAGVLRAAITALPALKKLLFEDLPASVFQGLQLNAGLEEFEVRGCPGVDLAALRTLATQVRATLTTLTFITPAETSSPFFPAFQLPHLTSLDIDAPLPFFVLSGFSSSPLRTLRCSRLFPEVTDEDDEDFAALEQVMEEHRASLMGLEVRLPEDQEGDKEVWRNEEAWERLAASCQRRGVHLKLGGQWWDERDYVCELTMDIMAPTNF